MLGLLFSVNHSKKKYLLKDFYLFVNSFINFALIEVILLIEGQKESIEA